MSSFTRNSRRANSDRRSRALGAGLALTLASGAALAHGAHRFMFTAYGDALAGDEVIAGHYDAALELLKSHPGDVDLDPSAANTNSCVAYSMTLQWQEARAACDAAVREARRSWAHESDADYLAVAYANRAVLEWMSSDEAAARKDLAKAQEISPQADFVAQNLAALATHGEVAQAKARGEMAEAGAPAPKS